MHLRELKQPVIGRTRVLVKIQYYKASNNFTFLVLTVTQEISNLLNRISNIKFASQMTTLTLVFQSSHGG